MVKKYVVYIYIIKNKIDKDKVYIGQTRTSIKQRWTQHKSAVKNKKNNYTVLYNAMSKYGIDNFEISCIDTIEEETKDVLISRLNELEMRYISEYNSLIPNGYNMTKGGDSTSVRNCKSVTSYFYDGTKDRTFENASEASRFYSNNNISNPGHIIQRCNGNSQYCYNRIWRYFQDSFDKFPINISKSELENGVYTPVDKYTFNGEIVKSYKSISDAINDDEQVKNPSPIRLCCEGKYNQAYGYVWRYSGDLFEKYSWKENQQYTAVDAYDINGNFLKSFKCIEDALDFYNIGTNRHIIDCCNGKRKLCNNMVWRFKGDPFDKYSLERKIRKDSLVFNRYDLNNNFIETIKSTKNLNSSPAIILDCCNGNMTHVGD